MASANTSTTIDNVIEELLVAVYPSQIDELSWMLSSLLQAYVTVVPHNGINAIIYQPYNSTSLFSITQLQPSGVVNEYNGAIDNYPETVTEAPVNSNVLR